MIDITNCNKIIVDTIGKTEKIIEWYQQNKDWLDAEEFRIPIPSALVELPEEDIKFYYEQEGVFVRLHLYMGGVYVCNYRYDPKTQEIENIVFPAGLSKEKRKVARMVLAADRTPYKEALKFHSLMCFATHYRNCIETTEQKEKRISHKHRKILRRSGGATPLITTYRIDSRPVPADGTKRHYTKPTEQVSVRGFYRTTKTGKRVWVRPFTKYNGNSGNNKTYKVCAVRMICMIVRKNSLPTTKPLEENLRLNPQSRSCAETSVLSLRNCRKTSVI